MQFAKVIGQVVSTRKEGKLEGLRLLIVDQLDEKLKPTGKTITSTDTVNARLDDIVLVCSSSSARMTSKTKGTSTDNSIVGIVETVSGKKRDWFKR
ncbi:EutN/CcmL family microcompartment protein [bacterium]|nr:EutN/CcmL family microcompartment protein [bacterium]